MCVTSEKKTAESFYFFFCEFIFHIRYRYRSREVGTWLFCVYVWLCVCVCMSVFILPLFFAARHITEAASKHQVHLFVRFVNAILCSRALLTPRVVVHRATGAQDVNVDDTSVIILFRCSLELFSQWHCVSYRYLFRVRNFNCTIYLDELMN